MEEKKNDNKVVWIVGTIIILAILITIIIINVQNNASNVKQIKLGEMVVLNEQDKQLLRTRTIENINGNLKSPATANYENDFDYLCIEPNIIKINGYVDSQNSFGAIIRSKFVCEYFAVNTIIDTLIYLKFDDTELLDIKETYVEEYKKQAKVDVLKQEGNRLNQKKLDYIMNDFNKDELNNVGEILKTQYGENEIRIDVKVTAKSSKTSKEDEEYWTNFNICSILHYFNEFDIVGIVKMNIYSIDNKKIVELTFDNDFIKNKWNDNSQINLVKEIFGENYKEEQNANSHLSQKEKNYIDNFVDNTNMKEFVEAETSKRFNEMMKWCSEENIYNELFSKSLKKKLTLKQFKNYKLNSFGIEGISAMILADDSVYISFIDSANGGAYGVKIKDKAIIEFKKV